MANAIDQEDSERIINEIDRFDEHCAAREHTDVGEVWILLQWIRSALLCGGIEEGVEELNRQAQKADHGEAPF